MTERRYTDEEFALILRRAASIGRREPTARGSRDGLTLDELQAIAREVGLDPDVVAKAARSLPMAREGRWARLFGGPGYFEMEFEVDRAITQEDTVPIAAAVRRALRVQGTSQWSGGGMEWTSTGAPTQVSVDMVPRNSVTQVTILADRGGTGVLTVMGSVLVGLGLGGVLSGVFHPAGLLESVGVFAGAGAGALATARALWSSTTRRTRARLARLVDTLSATLQTLP
jgi:hypothetical protein